MTCPTCGSPVTEPRTEAGRALLDRYAPFAREGLSADIVAIEDEARADPSELQDDLAEMLRIVGISDHARPISPHEVVQRELLPRLREMAAALGAAREREGA